MKECTHNELKFKGRNLIYLVCCDCGTIWERFVDYSGSNRITRFIKITKEEE